MTGNGKMHNILNVSISDDTSRRLVRWQQRHIRRHLKNINDLTWTFMVTSNGIGQIIKVRCNVCRKILNITEYDNW